MALKLGEVGKIIRVSLGGFDASGNTSVSIVFTHSDGTTFTVTSPNVTVGAGVTDPDLGVLAANTYLEYTTTGTEFTKAGPWAAVAKYVDGTPKTFIGAAATLTVGA